MTESTEVENITCFDHVPTALRTWFVIHAVVDYVIAIPLFLIPTLLLEFMGWNTVDPIMARLVAAALFGIGGISFFSRDEQVNTYRTLVTMKMIWSITAEIGFLVSFLVDMNNFPGIAWAFFGMFVIFTMAWGYWLNLLKSYE